MAFQDNLAVMPDISRLSGLDVCGENGGVLHHIPAAPGKRSFGAPGGLFSFPA